MTEDDEVLERFLTPEGRSQNAWDHVREMRKVALEAAGKGANAAKVFPYTQRLYDADRNMQSMLMTEMFHWFAAAKEKREELEARVAELEKCPVTYQGTYEEGASYPAKSFVSHAGSTWWSPVKTKARPGEGRDWVLAVKRGRDGKDIKP